MSSLRLKNLSLIKIPKKVNIHIVIGEVTIIIFVIPKRVRPTYKCPIPKGRKSSRRKAVSWFFCLYEQYILEFDLKFKYPSSHVHMFFEVQSPLQFATVHCSFVIANVKFSFFSTFICVCVLCFKLEDFFTLFSFEDEERAKRSKREITKSEFTLIPFIDILFILICVFLFNE